MCGQENWCGWRIHSFPWLREFDVAAYRRVIFRGHSSIFLDDEYPFFFSFFFFGVKLDRRTQKAPYIDDSYRGPSQYASSASESRSKSTLCHSTHPKSLYSSQNKYISPSPSLCFPSPNHPRTDNHQAPDQEKKKQPISTAHTPPRLPLPQHTHTHTHTHKRKMCIYHTSTYASCPHLGPASCIRACPQHINDDGNGGPWCGDPNALVVRNTVMKGECVDCRNRALDGFEAAGMMGGGAGGRRRGAWFDGRDGTWRRV